MSWQQGVGRGDVTAPQFGSTSLARGATLTVAGTIRNAGDAGSGQLTVRVRQWFRADRFEMMHLNFAPTPPEVESGSFMHCHWQEWFKNSVFFYFLYYEQQVYVT